MALIISFDIFCEFSRIFDVALFEIVLESHSIVKNVYFFDEGEFVFGEVQNIDLNTLFLHKYEKPAVLRDCFRLPIQYYLLFKTQRAFQNTLLIVEIHYEFLQIDYKEEWLSNLIFDRGLEIIYSLFFWPEYNLLIMHIGNHHDCVGLILCRVLFHEDDLFVDPSYDRETSLDLLGWV